MLGATSKPTLPRMIIYYIVRGMIALLTMIYVTCVWIVWDMIKETYRAFVGRNSRKRDRDSGDDV